MNRYYELAMHFQEFARPQYVLYASTVSERSRMKAFIFYVDLNDFFLSLSSENVEIP